MNQLCDDKVPNRSITFSHEGTYYCFIGWQEATNLAISSIADGTEVWLDSCTLYNRRARVPHYTLTTPIPWETIIARPLECVMQALL